MNKRKIGADHEEMAGRYLHTAGVRIVASNYRVKYGEIDIIGYDGDDLVFFEVKYRSGSSKGFAADAVGISKQIKICRVADMYLVQNDVSPDTQVRFDVIAIDGTDIEWIRNAFEYIPRGK